MKSPLTQTNAAWARHTVLWASCSVHCFWEILNNAACWPQQTKPLRTSCTARREPSSGVQTSADLRGNAPVVSGWHFNSLCFHPRHDACRQPSVCALLPHYCSCACLNRKASPQEPESPWTRSPWHPPAPSQMLRSEVARSPKITAPRVSLFLKTKQKKVFALRCF